MENTNDGLAPSFNMETPNHYSLPRRINRLGELAFNMWWTWNPDAMRLFVKIRPPSLGEGLP